MDNNSLGEKHPSLVSRGKHRASAGQLESPGEEPEEVLTSQDSESRETLSSSRPSTAPRHAEDLFDLFEAIRRGSRGDVLRCLSYLAPKDIIAARTSGGESPLHLAVKTSKDIVLLLLEEGCDLLATDDHGRTPLHLAAKEGNYHFFPPAQSQELLAGANKSDAYGWTPLHYAAAFSYGNDQKHHDSVHELLAHKRNILALNMADPLGWTPLHCAVASGNVTVVDSLLNEGADLEAKTTQPRTLIGRNIVLGVPEAHSNDGPSSRVLNVSAGQTPLLVAITLGRTTCALALLQRNAHLDVEDLRPADAVSLAISSGDEEILQLCLKHGANLPLQTKEVSKAFKSAIRSLAGKGREPMLKLILEAAISEKVDRRLYSLVMSNKTLKAWGVAYMRHALRSDDDDHVLTLLQYYSEWVAQETFSWIGDLEGEDLYNVVLLLRDAAQEVPWTLSGDVPDLLAYSPERWMNTHLHSKNCVHGTDYNWQWPLDHIRGFLSEKREMDPGAEIAMMAQVRKSAGVFCGLAGAYPPCAGQVERVIQVEFEITSVNVVFGDQDPAALFEQLYRSISGICLALRILQDSHFCCQNFTVLVADEPYNGPKGLAEVARLARIRFVDVKRFAENLMNLFDTGNELVIQDCSSSAAGILQQVAPEAIQVEIFGILDSESSLDHLHICALAVQILSFAVSSYSQAHTGRFLSPYLIEPLRALRFRGSRKNLIWACATLCPLDCFGDMLKDDALVLSFQIQAEAVSTKRMSILGCAVDIADTWGATLFISQRGGVSRHREHGEDISLSRLELGGGIIHPYVVQDTDWEVTWCHWSDWGDAYDGGNITFGIEEMILIGVSAGQSKCILDLKQSRKAAEYFICDIGTTPDTWKVAQKQLFLQGGQYVAAQVGVVYSKQPGITLKRRLLDKWAALPDLRMFDLSWGVQVSLCTGLARRAPLRMLMERPLLDCLLGTRRVPRWWHVLEPALTAFHGDSEGYITWLKGLADEDLLSVIESLTHCLDVLKVTGVNESVLEMILLWPHEYNMSSGVKIACRESNLWVKILKDSESCATFAVLTPSCFETSKYRCKKLVKADWNSTSALLSTAVCPDISKPTFQSPKKKKKEHSKVEQSETWQLSHDQKYWIGQPGSDTFVVVHKVANAHAILQVKENRFPKIVVDRLQKKFGVLRERQDNSFDAEDVVVLGDPKSLTKAAVPLGKAPLW